MKASYRTWMTTCIQHNLDGYCAGFECRHKLLPDKTFQGTQNRLLFCASCGESKLWTYKRPLAALELLAWTPPEVPLPKLLV